MDSPPPPPPPGQAGFIGDDLPCVPANALDDTRRILPVAAAQGLVHGFWCATTATPTPSTAGKRLDGHAHNVVSSGLPALKRRARRFVRGNARKQHRGILAVKTSRMIPPPTAGVAGAKTLATSFPAGHYGR